MNVKPWSRFGVYDDFFNNSFGALTERRESRSPLTILNADIGWRPAADIKETDSEYLIEAQLPGVAKKDVDISIDRGILTIQGERRSTKSSEDEQVHRSESFYGKYSRAFALPDDVNEKKLKAACRDGVLTIHLPKMPTKKDAPQRIPVD